MTGVQTCALPIYELTDRLRRVTPAAETADGRHTGIVPTVDETFFYQSQQVAFAHQRIAQVELVEFVLVRTMVVQILAFFHPIYEQVVQRTVRNKLQCTQRVGYTFKVVALSVSEIIHRVSLPCSTRTVVRMLHNAIDNRVAEVHVGACHVNLDRKSVV